MRRNLVMTGIVAACMAAGCGTETSTPTGAMSDAGSGAVDTATAPDSAVATDTPAGDGGDAPAGDSAGPTDGAADAAPPDAAAPGDTAPVDTAPVDALSDTAVEDAGDAAADAGADAGGGCPNPLSDEDLQRLAFGLLMPSVPVAPGGTRDFDLWLVECCYVLQPVAACVVWSVSPAESGATISQDGLLAVDAGVAVGTVFTVTADVENGKRILTQKAVVTTQASNPLLGTWSEAAQLACTDGSELVPDHPVGEVAFFADGELNVTWSPFEVYVDYWGQYSYDLETKAFSFGVSGGNFIPDDIDGEGTFELTAQGKLVLHDVWFGTPQGAAGPKACGHVLQ